MKASRVSVRCLALVFSMVVVDAAHAVLTVQGRDIYGNVVAADAAAAVMEYDPNLNITWLRDWNKNGIMDWNTAKNWASTLTVGSFGGWSLPSSLNQDGTGPCVRFNCSSSQMGYMFYTELGKVVYPGAVWDLTKTGPFQNVQRLGYWSDTEYAGSLDYVWGFSPDDGFQARAYKYGDAGLGQGLYAVAVRPGDVAAVPEAQAWALMLAGLSAVTVAVRWRPL